MARKSKADEWLTPNGLLRVKGWARDGLIDKQIAHNMGIDERTLTRWKTEHPSILSALKEGKAPVDIEVENALLKSALGHKETVRKAIKVRTRKQLKDKGLIEEEHIEFVDEEVYIPPQPVAQFFWLKNRRPDKWRDKPIEATSNGPDLEQPDDALTAALREEAAKLESGEVDDGAE